MLTTLQPTSTNKSNLDGININLWPQQEPQMKLHLKPILILVMQNHRINPQIRKKVCQRSRNFFLERP